MKRVGLILLLAFAAHPAWADDDLLSPIFAALQADAAKLQGYDPWKEALAPFELRRDHGPRAASGQPGKAYRFWQKHKADAPENSAMRTYGLSTNGTTTADGRSYSEPEVWDFNGDGRADFKMSAMGGTGHCMTFALMVSRPDGTYDHYGNDDLYGGFVGEGDFCSGDGFETALLPVSLSGRIYWLFIYRDQQQGRIRLFDFRQPKAHSLVDSIRFRVTGMLADVRQPTGKDWACDKDVCKAAMPDVREAVRQIWGQATIREFPAINVPPLPSEFVGLQEELDKAQKSGSSVTSLSFASDDINNDGHPDKLALLCLADQYKTEERLYWLQDASVGPRLVRIGVDFGAKEMRDSPKTGLHTFAENGGHLRLLKFGGKTYVTQIANTEMGWHHLCCGVGIYEITDGRIKAVDYMSVAPIVAHTLEKVDIK